MNLMMTGGSHSGAGSVDIAAVPEPSPLVLLGVALAGLAGYGWWKRKRRAVA